jgi:hypothetical protein
MVMKKIIYAVLFVFSFCLISSGEAMAKRETTTTTLNTPEASIKIKKIETKKKVIVKSTYKDKEIGTIRGKTVVKKSN